MERAEDEFGEWGTIYLDDDGRVLGSMQYGPAHLFPRAADLPAGPPSDDAVLVTCSYLVGNAAVWVEQSLLLAAIGEARDRGARGLEAFAYRYRPGESTQQRFLVHRTVFPRDFLEEFGFFTLRAQGNVELCRLELGGLQPVEEGRRATRAPRRAGGVHARAGAHTADSVGRPTGRQRQRAEPRVGERRPGDRDEAPVPAGWPQREAEDAERVVVRDLAPRPRRHDRRSGSCRRCRRRTSESP